MNNRIVNLVSGLSQESRNQILREYADWELVCGEDMSIDKLRDGTLLEQTSMDFIQAKGLSDKYITLLCTDLYYYVCQHELNVKIETSISNAMNELDIQLDQRDYNNVKQLVSSYEYNVPLDEINKVIHESVKHGLISKDAEMVVQRCIGEGVVC